MKSSSHLKNNSLRLESFAKRYGLLVLLLFVNCFFANANIDTKTYPFFAPSNETTSLIKQRLSYNRLMSLSGDPVYFTLRSSKHKVEPNEEFELTISANYMADAHKTFLVDRELYGYTLRLTMPSGFVVTGGSYYDMLQGRVSAQTPTQHYTLKGYFIDGCENCEFKLLRGTYYRNPWENLILKQSLKLNVPEDEAGVVSKDKNLKKEQFLLESSQLADSRFIGGESGFRCIEGFSEPQLKLELMNLGDVEQVVYVFVIPEEGGTQSNIMKSETIAPNNVVSLLFGSRTEIGLSGRPNFLVYKVLPPKLDNGYYDFTHFPVANQLALITSTTYEDISNFKVHNYGVNSVPENTNVVLSPLACFNGHVKWYVNGILTEEDNTGKKDFVFRPSNIGANTIQAICTQLPSLSSPSSCSVTDQVLIEVTSSGPDPCASLPNPSIALEGETFSLGDYFNLVLSGCNGSVKWYKGSDLVQTGGNSLFTNVMGSYHAACTYSQCNGITKTSNSVSPNYAPLRIEHNVQGNEVVNGQYFELRAVGCAAGMVEWYTASGTTRYENPIWENAPGLYKARCVKDGNVFSDWVSVYFNLRSATTPLISKPSQCFYANEKVYVSGTCPTGMTLNWLDGSYTTSFPAYKEVTPGVEYRAQCCNGGGTPTNCGNVVSFTICTITPSINQIIADKEDPITRIAYAAQGEPVLLTATGCDYGTVKWDYRGQRQSGNPITVYGPGTYHATCTVSDQSNSKPFSKEVVAKKPDQVTIISSQSTAFPNQLLTLTSTGCNGGQVFWRFTGANQDTIILEGRTIDVTGPNTYYARCILASVDSPESSITIPLSSGLPKIIVNKSRVRYTETFTYQVDYSACPNYGWPGGSTKITQNGVTKNGWGWDPEIVTGPAVIEASCGNASSRKQIKEIFTAPGDNIRLVANKEKVSPSEEVILTTYGCDFGYIVWQIGDSTKTGSIADPVHEIKQYGPGLYKARCKEDFNVNSDWVSVYVDIIDSNSILPGITGPNTLCPNTAATLTTEGCPSGYYHVWSTLEQGGFVYGGGTSKTIYLPQTVKLRCHKNDNSWTSDEKPFTIHPAIPDDIKATSNSPISTGETAQLAGTAITGATYEWTTPGGEVHSTRTLRIPNASSEHTGEYKLKVTSAGCTVEVSTRLDVNLCDNLYIKAFDPLSGEEKTKLLRKPGQVNLYDDLVLQVETFDGDIMNGVDYTWAFPQGVTGTLDPFAKYKVTVNKVGNYKVNITSPSGVSCPLEIDISALVCATPTDFASCGATSSVSSSGTEKLKNLAVGDEFTTYDYIVRVTEVSGSEISGWTGKGELMMNFLSIGNAALEIPLAVKFDTLHLNQCYQILPGSKVVTEFDPNWSNVVSVDVITDRLVVLYAEIKDLLVTDPNNKTALDAKVKELEDIKTELTDANFNPQYKAEQLISLNKSIDAVSCYSSSTTGARLTNTCSVDDVKAALDESKEKLFAVPAFLLELPKTVTPSSSEDKKITEALLSDALYWGGKWLPMTFSNGKKGEYKSWQQIYVIKKEGEIYWYDGDAYYIQGTCLKNQDESTARLAFKKCVNRNADGTCNYECVDLNLGTSIGSDLVDKMAYGFVGIMSTAAGAPIAAQVGTAIGGTAFGQTAAGQFIAENTGQWFITSFLESWAFCYECDEAQFAKKFAAVLALNITGEGVLVVASKGFEVVGKALFRETLKHPELARLVRMPELLKANWKEVLKRFKVVNNAGDVLFGSARQFVRNKYGQNVLNQLTAKFGASNDGAAAVILQKWGDDGLAILNKSTVNSLDDVAKELVKNKTMYRYVNETSYNFDKLRTQGLIDASPSQFPGYATLDKIDDAAQAQSILQLPKQPTWVAEFSSSQIINDVRFPTAKFNNADYTEVLTRSYPEWGVGGGSQFITNSQIKVTKLRNLTTGEVITFP